MTRAWIVVVAMGLALGWAAPSEAVFTVVSVLCEPLDNVSDTDEPQVFPSMPSATAGDLVYLQAVSNGAGLTFTRSNDGGQAWADLAGQNAAAASSDAWWATFNGTWSANVGIEPSGSGAQTSVCVFVLRPTSGTHTVAIDVTLAWESEGAGTTYTQTGQTRTGSSCLSVASFIGMGGTASTWGSVSGTGWTQVTSPAAQFRITPNTDVSTAFAHNVGTGASNNVSLTQNQSVAGVTSMVSWCETASSGRRGPAMGVLP